ncbi:MAG: bifunctional tetrahydrofolate synthase/dihydrofolate synthase [Candidatus Dasytiphilus stammeri]
MNQHPPNASSSLTTWLKFIQNRYPSQILLGLERIRKVAKKLNLLQPAPIIFTVGGTNGKGTTCRAMEMILLAAGYRTGVYTSPHLLRYTERIRIKGHELEDEAYTLAFSVIESYCNNILISWFEFTTLVALYLFTQFTLDVVILEVGLGGRLDATNIIDSDISVITSIGLDHTTLLGTDIVSIGREKSGIFRSHKPAIIGELNNSINILTKEAYKSQAVLYIVNYHWIYIQNTENWSFYDEKDCIRDLPFPKIPVENAATAIAALRYSSLKISKKIIISSLPTIALPGRFQIIDLKPKVILDVAHNPQAAQRLAKQLELYYSSTRTGGKKHAVIGILCDKDIEGIIKNLVNQIDYWYCASTPGLRGTSAVKLSKYLPQAKIFNRISQAWNYAMHKADKNDIVLASGSFYTVAQVISCLNKEYSSIL